MTLPEAAGLLLAGLARIITGAQGHWLGSPPKAEQRIYFANHQSHFDWVLIWAALPGDLRAVTRPIAARDYWTSSKLKHWITREIFNAVYVSRQRTDDEDPLEPLMEALRHGDSLVIFPEGTRGNKAEPAPFKAGLYHLAEAFPEVHLIPTWIDNVQRVMPKGEVVPVPILCSVTFGAPLTLAPGEDKRAFLDRAPKCRAGAADERLMGALRDLSVSQQIGLLFVGLFGLLALVTVVAFTRTLRDRSPEQLDAHEQFKRDLRAVWIGAVLFWVAWIAGGIVSTLLFTVVSFLALREFVTLTHTRRGDHRSLLLAFFVVLPLQYVIVASELFDLFTVFIPVYVFLAIPVVSAIGNDPQRFLERTAKIQWGIMVCVYGMSHAPALLLLDLPDYAGRGAFLVLYLVLVVATAQIVQESASRRLRRRPAARAISRSFSWNAWAIGAVASGVVGALLYWSTPFKPIPALVMGMVAGGSGTLGEFVMKALKRDAGVRSWGGKLSVTGAVGLLDRVAPLCFAAPVFFHSVRWYFGF